MRHPQGASPLFSFTCTLGLVTHTVSDTGTRSTRTVADVHLASLNFIANTRTVVRYTVHIALFLTQIVIDV